MPNINNVLDTIAREATVGTPVTREYVIPISGIPGLDSELSKESDPVINGENMSSGSYLLSKNNNDSGTPISPRSVKAMALLLHSLLGGGSVSGNDLQGVQISAILRIKYTGSEASAKVICDTTALSEELTADIGDLGSETADTNFGTSGVYDISTGTETVDSLEEAINGDTDWEAEFVMGDRTQDCVDIINYGSDTTPRQAANTWCYIYFSSTTSGVYTYEVPVVIDDTERPSLTRQVDNRGDNEVYGGYVVDLMSISGAIQAFVEGNIQGPCMAGYRPQTGITGETINASTTVEHIDTRELCPGMGITGTGIPGSTTIASITTVAEDGELELSQAATASATVSDIAVTITASSLTLEQAEPFIFYKGNSSIDGTKKTFIRNFSWEVNNQHAADIGYGQGAAHRQLQQKGKVECTGTIQLAMDSDAYALRGYAHDGEMVSLTFELKGEDYGSGFFAYLIIELPYCEITASTRPENSDQVDMSFDYMAVAPAGTRYNDPIKATLVIDTATI